MSFLNSAALSVTALTASSTGAFSATCERAEATAERDECRGANCKALNDLKKELKTSNSMSDRPPRLLGRLGTAFVSCSPAVRSNY